MNRYTFRDVIIDPEDPRVEVGARYYTGDTPKEVLWNANEIGMFGTLKSLIISDKPFHVVVRGDDDCYSCLIRRGGTNG